MQEVELSKKFKENAVTTIGLACMFLFLYTGYNKLIDHQRFEKGIANVHFLREYSVFVSWFVPCIEILISFLLMFPKTLKLGFLAFASLMLIFTGYIAGMLLWAKHMPCGCGGVIEKMSWIQHLWFNLIFLALSIFALRLKVYSKTA